MAAFSVAFTLIVAGLPATPVGSAASTAITVDGTQRFQRMDGFGVNVNPKNWNFSDLTPALDLLTNQLHANLWRVDIYGTTTWIDDPSHLNAAYYSVIYETQDFQALWQTLRYLNAHNAQVVLAATGLVPTWMGANGTVIDPAQEDNFVEMLTSVVDYGRRVKGINITMLDPLNETDQGPPEGPSVWQDQFDRISRKLVTRLDALGYSDVQLMVPNNASVENVVNFVPALTSDPVVLPRITHFGFHSYSGSSGNVDGWVKGAGPDKNFWMSEWSQVATDGELDVGKQVADEWLFGRQMTDELLSLLGQGAAGALAWDAWDNKSVHHPAWTYWGLLAYSGGGSPPTANGTYTPKKRFYTNAQVFEFVPTGWQRIAAGTSDSSVPVVAFSDPVSGQFTVVGHNTQASPVTLGVSLAGVGAASSAHWYETNATENLISRPDVAVAGGSFSADIPADSFFTFTTLGAGPTPTSTPGSTTPTATATLGATSTPSATPTPLPVGSQTLIFDDLSGADRPLNGQYPSGVVDWGNGAWYLSSPWGQFTTKSISFNGPTATSASLTLLGAQTLVQVDAYNGAATSSTVSLSCPGQTTATVAVPAGALQTIGTGWSAPCAAITIGSSQGWHTNFDNVVLASGSSATPTAVATSTPTPAATSTTTPTATATPTSTPTLTSTPASTSTPTGVPTPTPGAGATQTLIFDDLAGADHPLIGQYPSGVVDWGGGAWYLASPWGRFTTKNISFNGPTATSASLTLLGAQTLVQLDAYNGATTSSTVSLSCPGQTTATVVVPAGALQTISTGWSAPCAAITIGSSQGWHTNFDNVVLASGSSSTPTAVATSTPTLTSTPASTSTPTGVPTPTPGAGATQTLIFDDLAGADHPLIGQYPTGVVDWGGGAWYLASPWGRFTTKNISFNGPTATSASLTLLGAQTLVQLDAYNGATTSSTVSLSCPGQTTATVVVPAGALQTISTGWSAPCAAITIGSSQGWHTNFDNVVLASGSSATPTAVATSTPTPPPTSTPTPVPTNTPLSTPTNTPAPTLTPTAVPTTTVTFNDVVNPNRSLNGAYPAGVIDWGAGVWWVSGPYGLFTSNSVSFNGAGPTSASFTLLSPRRVVQVEAYNGGTATSALSLACGTQTMPTAQLPAGQRMTLVTNWTTPCTTVTVTSSNGWNTNFDNLVLQ